MIKRAFDLIASAVAFIFLSPVMLILGGLIRRDSDGPIIYKQERVGLDGQPFDLYKFRTMRVEDPTTSSPLVTADGDSRVTPIGERLRSTKLDELPQLWNVLRGDMSIVGPRPEVERYAQYWTEEQRREILSVRPGITDPASIEFRRESEFLSHADDPEKCYVEQVLPTKADIYVKYVRNRSFGSDLKIIFETLVTVVVK